MKILSEILSFNLALGYNKNTAVFSKKETNKCETLLFFCRLYLNCAIPSKAGLCDFVIESEVARTSLYRSFFLSSWHIHFHKMMIYLKKFLLEFMENACTIYTVRD